MLFRRIALALLVLASAWLVAGEPPAAKTFETPEAAWKAFLETLGTGDWKALEALVGPASAFIPPAARTPERLKKTAKDIGEAPLQVDVQGEQATFLVGGRPFPIAAKKTAKGWVLGDNAGGRADQEAMKNDVRCLSSLQTVGRAASLYAQKNGKFPASLEALTKGGAGAEPLVQPAQLLCPRVAEGKHRAGASGVPCDYLCLPLKPAASKEAIVAFCPKQNHQGKFRNCVFRNGTAGKIEDEAQFRSALRASLEAAGISLEPSKAGGAPPAAGSSAPDAEWLKAIRAELADNTSSRDGAKATGGKSSGEAKPAGKKQPAKK